MSPENKPRQRWFRRVYWPIPDQDPWEVPWADTYYRRGRVVEWMARKGLIR